MWGTLDAAEGAGAVAVERRSSSDDGPPVAPEVSGLRPQLVCPGDVVTADPGALRGRGVLEREDGKLVATTCGVVERVNKLLYIRPLKHRYTGSIGDVVVGRIVEVQADRWAVEIGAGHLAYLHIGSINLPGNIQRRRTEEDLLKMREFFVENDVISGEVLELNQSGGISIQTRNARYGRLQNGMMAQVHSVFVRRQAQHIVTLPNIGVMVVLGNNGWVWVCAPPKSQNSGRFETMNFSQMDTRYELVYAELRERICRVRNVVMSLAALGLEVTPESITFLFDESLKRGLAAWELLDVSRCDAVGLAEAAVDDAISRDEHAGQNL